MNAMRRWRISALMLAGAVATASGQTSAPFILRISGPGTVAPGQPVLLRVLLQNTSDHVISLMGPNATLVDGSALSIYSPSGQEVPRKDEGWVFSGGISRTGPGEVSDEVLRVDSSSYDLSEPGRYTLQLKRPIAEDRSGRDGFISSNVITVTVSPEIAKPNAPLLFTLTGPETFVSGSDVSANALARNISDQEIFLVTDPDGTVADRYYRVKSIVAPNNAVFYQPLAHSGKSIIRTISPGATLETKLNKNALGFSADWILSTVYRFQLLYSADMGNDDPVASNVLTIKIAPPPPGGPTPFTLTITGPGTVTAGEAVRVDLVEKDTSNFGSLGAQDQLNLLEYTFSVRDPSGRELPLNSQANGVTGAHHLKALESGWTSDAYAVLSDFYDMSQPGAYRVQMSHAALAFTQAGRVFSNVITIHVTPR
jgi:hypothetical protein